MYAGNQSLKWTFGVQLFVLAALAAHSSPSWAQNVVTDPSFEGGTRNWTLRDGNSSIDSRVARTGAKSLRLENDGKPQNHNVEQTAIGGVRAGQEYVYSVWVRGTNVTGTGNGGKPLAVVRWRDKANNILGTHKQREMYMWAKYGTQTEWYKMQIHLQAPQDAAKVDIAFRSWYVSEHERCIGGTTNWDDASLVLRDLSHRGILVGTYQAEAASSSQGGTVDSDHWGFTSKGYFEPNSAGAHVEWRNVSGGATGGKRILAFRYSWEGGAQDLEVSVNGKSLGRIRPLATGRLHSWASHEVQTTLRPGNNTIRLRVSKVFAGPLFDKLDVYRLAGSTEPTDAGTGQLPRDAGPMPDQSSSTNDAGVMPDHTVGADDATAAADASATPSEEIGHRPTDANPSPDHEPDRGNEAGAGATTDQGRPRPHVDDGIGCQTSRRPPGAWLWGLVLLGLLWPVVRKGP